ncbi:hypothetical protein Tco_0845249 [Tanacetum coccineum]
MVKWVHSVKLRGKSTWEISVDQDDSWDGKIILIGPLFEFITYRDLYDERLNGDLKVSEMIGNGEWKWSTDWYDKFPMITNFDIEGKVLWKTNNEMFADFSVSIANHDLNNQSLIVQCSGFFCFDIAEGVFSFWDFIAVLSVLLNNSILKRVFIVKDNGLGGQCMLGGIESVCKMNLLGPPYTLSKEVRMDIFKGVCSQYSDALFS